MRLFVVLSAVACVESLKSKTGFIPTSQEVKEHARISIMGTLSKPISLQPAVFSRPPNFPSVINNKNKFMRYFKAGKYEIISNNGVI